MAWYDRTSGGLAVPRLVALVACTGLTLSVAGALVTTGCGHGCTEVGCDATLTLRVVGQPTLVSGEYELVVVVDGQTLTCPVPLSTTPAVAEFPCRLADGSPGGMTFFKVPSSGSPFHLEGDLSEAPSRVEVTVFRDGVEVASAGDDAVAYETYFPNGEGCPPTCRRADDVEVTVP